MLSEYDLDSYQDVLDLVDYATDRRVCIRAPERMYSYGTKLWEVASHSLQATLVTLPVMWELPRHGLLLVQHNLILYSQTDSTL